MQQADWYFDPISPFAYLHLEQLDALSDRLQLRFRPLLLVALLNRHGHLGPAEIPAKRRFTYRHVQWRAETLGIPLRFPDAHPFNPLALLRLAVLIGDDQTRMLRLMRSIWRDGQVPMDGAAIDTLGQRLGIEHASERIAEPAVKATLRNHADEALELGLFGVPSLIINGELFWGEDSTGMLCDYLDNPQLFDRDTMRRLDQLPVGASRVPPKTADP